MYKNFTVNSQKLYQNCLQLIRFLYFMLLKVNLFHLFICKNKILIIGKFNYFIDFHNEFKWSIKSLFKAKNTKQNKITLKTKIYIHSFVYLMDQ